MQIKTNFFLRLFILSFLPFLILSLLAVYLFNRGIEQVISPGFEQTLDDSEYLVENSLELYRLRFLNLIDILADDSITNEDLQHFDLILFLSESDTTWLKALEVSDHNRIFMEEAITKKSIFPEIISFEGSILIYQQISLQPENLASSQLVVGQYVPKEFSDRVAKIIRAKTDYGRLKIFVESAGSKIAWIIWISVTVIYLTFILYISRWWANSLIRPINNLSLAAFDIAKGNWGKKVNYNKSDELGTLVNSFNYMSTELKNSAEKLLRAQVEASWKNTARVIAHGIKNILSPIKVALYNLEDSGVIKKSDENLASMNSEISRLEEIADDFSQFARSPDIKPVLVNIKKVSEDVFELIGDKSSRIEKTVNVSKDLYLETDYEILRSLLLNLVKNSIEAISEDGTIEISARKDGKRVSISVRDTGMGVPEEYIGKIWQPYYTTKPSGTGLGLPIALKFADAIGCELELDSDSNGTTVTLIFGGDDEGKNTTG